jgi:hypothetical protein
MNFDIGPNLLSLIGTVAGVIVLWIKTSRDHSATAANVDALHDKVDAMVPPAPVSTSTGTTSSS